jgi:hypothetical protein
MESDDVRGDPWYVPPPELRGVNVPVPIYESQEFHEVTTDPNAPNGTVPEGALAILEDRFVTATVSDNTAAAAVPTGASATSSTVTNGTTTTTTATTATTASSAAPSATAVAAAAAAATN